MEEKDINHLEWVYERMKFVHNENENLDYMIRFREILEKYNLEKKVPKLEQEGFTELCIRVNSLTDVCNAIRRFNIT